MRLHHLEVTAFGPFAGTEIVDFDALADAGLFLFSGPTGAGKTSVLDAVCFALYAQVPGSRHGTRSLRSDHTPDGVAPRVVLEVTLRGRRFRITRSPQWERPKLRGSGTVTQQAKVHLEEHTEGDWTTLSTRLDETGDQVDSLLGLKVAQFCQVVLLPQGQFAEFLRADAEKRRDLLESLFDTRRFADVERWLVNRRQEVARELDDVDDHVKRLLARVAEAAGEELPDELAADGAMGSVTQMGDRAREQLADARAVAALAGEQHDAAATALEAATLVADAHLRRAALTARLAGLEAGADEHAAIATRLVAARTVAPLVPLVYDVARLQGELDQARSAAAEVSAAVADVIPTPRTGQAAPVPPPAALTALAREQRHEAAGLQALARDESEAERLAAQADMLERRVVELTAQAQFLQAHLDTAADRKATVESARDQSSAAAAALPGAMAALVATEARLKSGILRDALAVRHIPAADLVRTRIDAEQLARETWLRHRQDRLDGMAAELALGLQDDEACPVCGSDEHPRPAAATPDAVTREQEEAAGSVVRAAEQERARAQDDLAKLDADLAAATAAAGGDDPVTVLRATRDDGQRAAAALECAAAPAQQDVRALTAFGEEHEIWLRDSVALDEQVRALLKQAGDDRSRFADLRTALDAARGDDPSIGARALRLVAVADDLEALGRQVETAERLESEVANALVRAEEAAAARGIASLEQVLVEHGDDEELTLLDERLRRHSAELVSVREQLAEPVLAAVANSPSPDVTALRAKVRGAAQVRDVAVEAMATSTSRAAALSRLAADLERLVTDRAPVAECHHTVDGLARLAEGKSTDNRLRMSLSGYVLAARLEQVAIAASDRLLRMSSGRYQLVHTAVGATGRSRGGLLLRVLDAWTGVERDPASLSGGESFSASLALALGLADVVTAEAGGSLLETLFVDEGFGSLDEETLDEVMGVMDGLRDGGRVVGIVSHVGELRQRIPTQLTIVKSRNGSVIRQ
ncbi:MAG: SMC family ATPase [Sporichthyaceae bacterium]